MVGDCTVEPRLLKIPRLELNGKHWRRKREERAESKKKKREMQKRKIMRKKEKKEDLKATLGGSIYKSLPSLICQRKVEYKVFGQIGFEGAVKVPFRG